MKGTWATGEQFDLTYGGQTATITELGAALRAYGDEIGKIVDGTEADEPISQGRGQVLMPWPNRIKDGKYTAGDREHQLTITEVPLNNSSHGLLRWVNFHCQARSASTVTLTYSCHAQPGFPFSFDATIQYELGDDGLRATFSGCNTSPHAMPFGMGAHPYFTTGVSVDESMIRIPASSYMATDGQEIPTDECEVDAGTDYRRAKGLEGVHINRCFTKLERDANGIASVDYVQAEANQGVQVWMDASFDYVMIFTGDRNGVAIEPMTCAQNAYNNKIGLITLQPGETKTASWGIKRITG